MKIWIDADACPRGIKDIVFRAAERLHIHTIMVANQPLHTPRSKWITSRVVSKGFDVADEHILDEVDPEDIVITQDIPLAAEVIEKGAVAISLQGELYTASNIRQRLSVRNFLDDMRNAGVTTGGPAPFGNQQKQRFAGTLDRLLAKRKK